MTSSTEVKQFYDDFTASRMLQYKLDGNLRLDKAIKLIEGYLTPNSNLLDLGCGIGIVPEQAARKLKAGKILACDLGENNINYARKTIQSDKIDFLNVDIIEDFETISQKLTEPLDLITMIDVIEHLPPDGYETLWHNLSQVSSDTTKIILTYPSPEFQLYLQQNDPAELQIIDETIELNHLLPLAIKYGFNLEYFAYVDVWQRNQYIHCVFSKQRPYQFINDKSILSKINQKIKVIKSKIILPFLKNKYITEPNKTK